MAVFFNRQASNAGRAASILAWTLAPALLLLPGCATVVSKPGACAGGACVKEDYPAGIAYFLPMQRIKVKAILCSASEPAECTEGDNDALSTADGKAKDGEDLIRVSYEILPPEADASAMYYARPSHNWLRDDAMNVRVGENGLLSSSTVIARDQSTAVLVELGRLARLAVGGQGAAGSDGAADKSKKICDYYDGTDGFNSLALPLRFEGILDHSGWVGETTAETTDGILKTCFHRTVELKPLFDRAPAGSQTSGENANIDGGKRKRTLGGYAYRSKVPYLLTVRRLTGLGDDVDAIPVSTDLVMLPNEGPVSYVPMRSAAFVETETNVAFRNGVLECWDTTRPSEALEVVRLPLRMVETALKAPAQLAQLRINLGLDEGEQNTESGAADVGSQSSAPPPAASDLAARVRTCAASAGQDGS